MTQYDFTADLADRIVQYSSIPKLQVERIVGPILTIFIEDLVKIFLDGENYKLIAPEWPLKKENKQSTNIDWLMIHPSNKCLLAIELKTSKDSMDDKQLKRYLKLQDKVRTDGAGFLLSDVNRIKDASKNHRKYDSLLSLAEPFNAEFNRIHELKILYLAPTSLIKKIQKYNVIIIGLRDFPSEIPGSQNIAWQKIRHALVALDSTKGNEVRIIDKQKESNDLGAFARQIESRLKRDGNIGKPIKVWFGRTGTGSTPNYQIEFQDGSVVPFRNSGKRFKGIDYFKETNLNGPYEWITLVKNENHS